MAIQRVSMSIFCAAPGGMDRTQILEGVGATAADSLPVVEMDDLVRQDGLATFWTDERMSSLSRQPYQAGDLVGV